MAVLGILALVNYFFAFMLSIEIGEHELMPLKKKIGWHVFTWLVPIVGPLLTHRFLKVGWAKGSGSGGGSGMSPPSDGGL
ncbi:hypothetical protein [Marinobacter sp. LN3S78]|uniref:hypothetical protein n=1 Tax=Marinobacter sp. LN3S78 TaxID=3382300 RepID=UPI00387A9748